MFGLFGGAAAVTATEVKPQGRFPHKNHFRHKTRIGVYDFLWTGWKPIYNQPICCAQWFAVPVNALYPNYGFYPPYGFYSSTTGTHGPMQSPSYVVDTTLIEGHPIITPYSTHKQKAHSRQDSFDRIMKMIDDWNKEPAKTPVIQGPMHYYTRDDAKRIADLPMKPGDLIPIEEMIAKFK
jgi:hypothetical protein